MTFENPKSPVMVFYNVYYFLFKENKIFLEGISLSKKNTDCPGWCGSVD